MAHSHCESCFLISCTADCPVQPCPSGCGASLHACKLDEHRLHVCPASVVPCTNAGLGCETTLLRADLSRHLPRCPASLVHCRFAYDRTTTDQPLVVSAQQSLSDESQPAERRLCIDEKAALADLALAEQADKFYDSRRPGNDGGPLQFSLDCHPGSLLSDPCSKSTAKNHTLPPRARVCLAASVSQYSYRGLTTVNYFCFPCNEGVRRDEFSGHWRDIHLGVHTNFPSIVERCPLRTYGCTHGNVRLAPTPVGATLEYLTEADCISVRLPDHTTKNGDSETAHSLLSSYAQHIQKQQELACYGYGEENDSYDVLSQLPAEILMKICGHLDSLGLWSLSLVNRYLRSVCYNLVKKRGIVYQCWKKDKATGKWEQGEKHWSFSRVYDGTGSWCYTDAPALCNHVAGCPLLNSLARSYDTNARWEMPCLQQCQSLALSESMSVYRFIRDRINSEPASTKF